MRFGADIFGFTDESTESTETETGTDTGDDSGGTSSSDSGVTVAFTKEALLVSKTAWDCTSKSEVNQIVISGAQPTGSNIRYMFKIDNKYWYFSGSTLTEFTGTFNVDNVLKSGNTTSQLTAMTNIASFVGKKVFPIIAMSSPSDAEDMPRVKMSLKVKVPSDTLTDTVESIVYELTDDETALPRIADVTYDATCTGAATVTVQIRTRKSGTWSAYMTPANAIDRECDAVQFKITYKVTKTDGTDSAKVNSITVDHTMGKTVVSGGNAHLHTVVADYDNDLQTCYVTVKHNPLTDSSVEAYVNFMRPPKRRNLIQIGTGTGARQELALGLNGLADSNIVGNSIALYADATPFSNFSFNTETGSVVLTAKKNAIITASYDYDRADEHWRTMTRDYTEPYNDTQSTVMTRFSYTLPDDELAGMSMSNIRITMRRPSGTASGSFGTATGKNQLFVPKHVPKASTIKFDSPDVDFDFNEDNNILSLVAPKGTALKCSYKWTGEKITVYSFAAGWACA